MVCIFDCFTCQEEFFVNRPFDVNGSAESALEFVLHFPLGEILLFLLRPLIVNNILSLVKDLEKIVAFLEAIS
jgi:hypothetical protein